MPWYAILHGVLVMMTLEKRVQRTLRDQNHQFKFFIMWFLCLIVGLVLIYDFDIDGLLWDYGFSHDGGIDNFITKRLQ